MRVPFITAGAAGIVALSAAFALPASAEDEGPRGSAFAVSLDATLLNAVKANITPQPRAVYPAGADKSAIKLDLINEQLLRARALNATSDVKDGQLTSVGSVADVTALRNTLKATLIEARCVTTPNGVEGDSKLVDVTIAGTKVTVDGQGELNLLDGAINVKVNEQIRQGDKLIVNALHVTVGKALQDIAKTDLILGSAACTAAKGGGEQPPTTEPSAPTTSPEAPGDGDGSDDGSADDGGLANTGVSNVGLFIGVGVVLVAGGVGTLVYLRRRGANTES